MRVPVGGEGKTWRVSTKDSDMTGYVFKPKDLREQKSCDLPSSNQRGRDGSEVGAGPPLGPCVTRGSRLLLITFYLLCSVPKEVRESRGHVQVYSRETWTSNEKSPVPVPTDSSPYFRECTPNLVLYESFTDDK